MRWSGRLKGSEDISRTDSRFDPLNGMLIASRWRAASQQKATRAKKGG